PPQHDALRHIWSALAEDEQKNLEKLMRKLLIQLDKSDN
ncbi:transcriptional repressor MprA, partial [Salmonella enterica subsp. enterica serovar Newport]|nr:transcriptional repressor MprA [Salmonella enterica subsp. enterica serovar Newport]